jgi:hypothetical protein
LKIIFKEKFLKEIEKMKDEKLKSSIKEVILNVEDAIDFEGDQQLKKIKGI